VKCFTGLIFILSVREFRSKDGRKQLKNDTSGQPVSAPNCLQEHRLNDLTNNILIQGAKELRKRYRVYISCVSQSYSEETLHHKRKWNKLKSIFQISGYIGGAEQTLKANSKTIKPKEMNESILSNHRAG